MKTKEHISPTDCQKQYKWGGGRHMSFVLYENGSATYA